jgi:hypothetical protein
MLKPVIGAACLCVTLAQPQASDLAGQQLSDLVAGATVEIDTPIGAKLLLRYARDGKLSGEAPSLAWYLGTASDNGRWWASSDQLCHKWNRWLDSKAQCMRLSKDGRVIRWRSRDGHTGTATVSVPAAIQAVAVLPLASPSPAKQIVAPVPRLVRAHGEAPAEPPEPPMGPHPPPPQVAKEAAPAVADAPPVPAPAQAKAEPDRGPPPPHQEARREQAEPKRAAAPMFKVARVRSDDVLNVRSGPSADFEVVGTLPPGSRGIAITSGCRSQWCPVQHQVASGWVNSAYLAPEEPMLPSSPPGSLGDAPEAPRACLSAPARGLLDRIERAFGPVQVVSTCRAAAIIPGGWRASRHASGNAVDFKAGSHKAQIVEWLIANHKSGGTMTYAGMDHIHVDIGPHFVSIANGPHWQSWPGGPGTIRGRAD